MKTLIINEYILVQEEFSATQLAMFNDDHQHNADIIKHIHPEYNLLNLLEVFNLVLKYPKLNFNFDNHQRFIGTDFKIHEYKNQYYIDILTLNNEFFNGFQCCYNMYEYKLIEDVPKMLKKTKNISMNIVNDKAIKLHYLVSIK